MITGHAHGIAGHYIHGKIVLVLNGRTIGPEEAIYFIFQPTEADRVAFERMITGAHPNQFTFVLFRVTYTADEGSKERRLVITEASPLQRKIRGGLAMGQSHQIPKQSRKEI